MTEKVNKMQVNYVMSSNIVNHKILVSKIERNETFNFIKTTSFSIDEIRYIQENDGEINANETFNLINELWEKNQKEQAKPTT